MSLWPDSAAEREVGIPVPQPISKTCRTSIISESGYKVRMKGEKVENVKKDGLIGKRGFRERHCDSLATKNYSNG